LGQPVPGVPPGGPAGGEGVVRVTDAHVRLPCMTETKEPGAYPDVAVPAPMPHATEEQVEAASHDTKRAQVLYHDWEAESYDDKWSIPYDQRCVEYPRSRF